MAAVARSPSPSPRPCPAMRRSADSNPFKPADCPSQRSAGSKGVCGCHHASSPSPRRRSLSFGEKENEPQPRDAVPVRTPKPAVRSGGAKNFMAPTISAASKAIAPSASPRSSGKVLGERNHDTPHLAPFSPANLAHKPKGPPPPEAGAPRCLRLSFDAPPAAAASLAGDDDAGVENTVRVGVGHHHAAADPVGADRCLRHSFEAPPGAHGPLAGDDDDAGMEDPVGVCVGVNHHQHAAADPVDAEPSRAALYDPKTNYTSPRPRFLHYKPNPRVDIYRHGGAGVRRLEDGFASASESSDETDATATTEDDFTEEEQEQAQQNHLSEALAAPSEACVLAPEPAPGSPRPPLLLSSEPAAVTPEPPRVSAPEPRATPPRARAALTPEPELGPAKKGSSLRFLFPLAFVLFMSAASVCVLLPPDSPIMSNTALSRASSFLSVQESHPVELAAWLKQWSSSSLDSITSYWEALASTSAQEQDYFGPHFAANWSAAAADGDHGAADFYYNFAEAWPLPSEEPISSANAFTAEPEGDVVAEEESVDGAGVGEKSDASDYYDMVVDELDVGMSEEAPGSSYGASVLEEQLKIQDAVSEASIADLIAESEGAAVVEEESDASDYSKAVDELDGAGVGEKSDASDYYDMVVDELDVGMSVEAPGSSYGASVLEEQLKIQDAVSEASIADLIAESEGAAVVEEESDASDYSKAVDELDGAGVGEKSDASDYYDMVVDELDVGMSVEAPGSSYGASVLEEQLKIQDAVSEASIADLIAESEGAAVVEEESDASDYSKAVDELDGAGVGEKSDASDYYDMVVDELDVGMSVEAPGSSYGASVLEEQLKIQDAVSEASIADLIAESEGAAVVEEECDASDYSKAVDELDVGASEAGPGSSNGEEMASFSQDFDTPSQPTGQREQDVESEEPEDNHGSGEEGQEPHLGLESDSSMSPSYMDRISKPAAAAGVAIVVVILSAGVAALSMRKTQAQVATGANVPAEQEQAEEAETRSGSASSEGHRLVKSPQAEETERFGDSGFSQYSSSLSSGHGRGKTKEEENASLEPASKRESMSYSTSSYGSFTTYEKIAAKKKNKDDEAMTPVRRSSRLRTVKSPEAESS